MARKNIEDIVIRNKKSVRQIPLSQGRKYYNSIKKEPTEEKIKSSPTQYTEVEEVSYTVYENNLPPKRTKYEYDLSETYRSFPAKYILWGIAGISVIVLVISIFSYFTSATVSVFPKKESITLDENLTFKLNPATGELGFSVLKIEKNMSKEIEASMDERIEQKASGRIVIYNNYSTAIQRLAQNTRFTNPDGLVYRIQKSVEVPGQKKVSGKLVPGSIEADVYADMPGDSYNMKASETVSTFKIPGFTGSPKYNSVYANIKSDIIGGYSGLSKKISPEVKKVTENELQNSLKETILAEVSKDKLDNQVLFNNTNYWEFSSSTISSSTPTTANISIHATYYGLIFNSQKIAKYLAQSKESNYNGGPVDLIWSPDTLKLVIDSNKLGSIKAYNATTITAKLTGQADIIWIIDPKVIAKEVVGLNKNSIESKLTPNSGISKIQAKISPFWKSVLPDNQSNIKVKIITN